MKKLIGVIMIFTLAIISYKTTIYFGSNVLPKSVVELVVDSVLVCMALLTWKLLIKKDPD
jgi:hypothetical protein